MHKSHTLLIFFPLFCSHLGPAELTLPRTVPIPLLLWFFVLFLVRICLCEICADTVILFFMAEYNSLKIFWLSWWGWHIVVKAMDVLNHSVRHRKGSPHEVRISQLQMPQSYKAVV